MSVKHGSGSKNVTAWLVSGAALLFACGAAFAQPVAKTNGGYPLVQQLDKTVTYASAADVAALMDKARKENKDHAAIAVGEFLKLAPYTANLEYREKGKIGDVGQHPKSAEFIYIIRGSGTIVTGGTIAADRMSIAGGQTQKIGKGDFLLIPAGLPHWINRVDRTIALASIFVPQAAPAP